MNIFIRILENVAVWVLAKLFPQPPLPPLPPDTPYPVLTQTVLEYNNAKPYWVLGPVWELPPKSVIIHKIDATRAEVIAYAASVSAAKYGLPLTFVLACLAVESVMDPQCQNGNTGPGESNTANDPLGYDMGIAQFKLRYLVGYAPSVTDAASAKAFAFDVERAIPYFCSLMAGKFQWAQGIIAKAKSAEPRLNNPLVLATCAFNFGNTGALNDYFTKAVWPNHCQSVVNDEAYFSQKLGTESVFSDLAA